MSFIVGGTEAEAKAKAEEYDQDPACAATPPTWAAAWASTSPRSGSTRRSARSSEYNTQGIVKGLIDSAPDKTWTFGDLLANRSMNRVVGTPEQVADRLEEWVEAGVGGINMPYYVTPGSFADFIDGAGPELQRRGLMQSEYSEGTLREKLADGGADARLPETHPGGRTRRERLGSPAAA